MESPAEGKSAFLSIHEGIELLAAEVASLGCGRISMQIFFFCLAAALTDSFSVANPKFRPFSPAVLLPRIFPATSQTFPLFFARTERLLQLPVSPLVTKQVGIIPEFSLFAAQALPFYVAGRKRFFQLPRSPLMKKQAKSHFYHLL